MNQHRPPPLIWKPTPGDTLTGSVVRTGIDTDDFGNVFPVITIRHFGEDIIVRARHVVLRRRLDVLQVGRGGWISIQYLGMPAGKRWHSYRVHVDRPNAPPTWTELQATTDWDGYEPFQGWGDSA